MQLVFPADYRVPLQDSGTELEDGRREFEEKIAEAQEEIAKAEEAIAELDVQMEAAACDYEKLNELVKQKETAQAELDALYERWEQLSEEAEG